MKCPYCGADIPEGSNVCEFCGSHISLEMKKELEQLNKTGCPKCGSSNIVFGREKLGEERGKKGTAIVRSTVGVCKDCGYTWSAESNVQIPKKRKTWLWVLGWIFIFPLPLNIILLRPTVKLDKRIKYVIIAAAWILYAVWIAGSRKNGSDQTSPDIQTSTASEQSESQRVASNQETKEITSAVTTQPDTTSAAETAAPEETVRSESQTDKSVDVKETDSDGVSLALKEFLDKYEAFMDEYCEFMNSYDSTNMSMLVNYASLMTKYGEFAEQIDKYDSSEMSAEDSLYYYDVMTRVNRKLMEAGLNKQ